MPGRHVLSGDTPLIDSDAAARTCGVGAAREDRDGLLRSGQSLNTLFNEIEVGACRQRIEEALRRQRDAIDQPGLAKQWFGPRDRARLIDEDSANRRMRAQHLREQGVPVPPPTSTTARTWLQSPDGSTSGSGMPWPCGPIKASKRSAMAGCAARSSQNGRPKTS